LLFPGQTQGFGGTTYLEENVTASEIEVQLLQGDPAPTEPLATFEVESVSYYAGEYFNYATGVIKSPYNVTLDEIRVGAVAYDEAGEIIGGGFTYVNFVPANGSVGAQASVVATGNVAAIELYPILSGLTLLGDERELPSGASSIVLNQHGFGQVEEEIGFGMILENPNSGFAVENSQYHVTAYAEDGSVLGTEEGYINVILPGQTLGVGGTTYLVNETQVAQVDVHFRDGEFVEAEEIPYFTADNVTFQPDAYFPKVLGKIVSPYDQDITDVRVSAITYNDAGEIIGGGFTFVDFVPANGEASAEVSVTVAGTPATTEMYATPSGLSEFR
jgi:hypothetical protein